MFVSYMDPLQNTRVKKEIKAKEVRLLWETGIGIWDFLGLSGPCICINTRLQHFVLARGTQCFVHWIS